MSVIAKVAERRHVCRKGAVIFEEGVPADRSFSVEAGLIQFCRYSSQGQRVVIGFAFPGEEIGLESDKYDSTAEAVTPAMLLEHVKLAEEDTAKARALTLCMHQAVEAIVIHSQKSATGRVAAFLLELVGRGCGGGFALPLPLADIADHLGLSVPTVSRAISGLRNVGAIARQKHTILIQDHHMLAAVIAQAAADTPGTTNPSLLLQKGHP